LKTRFSTVDIGFGNNLFRTIRQSEQNGLTKIFKMKRMLNL
jgi:hypothetical protein